MRKDTEIIPRCFADGCGGVVIGARDFMRSPSKYSAVATYGYLRGAADVLKYAMKSNMDYYYIDHAYIRRADSTDIRGDSWFRVTKNGWQAHRMVKRPQDRWDRYFNTIRVAPWNTRAGEILIIGLSNMMKTFWGLAHWERTKVQESRKIIRGHSLRVSVRPKGSGTRIPWGKVYGIICSYNTAMSVEALINGVPVFADAGNVAASCSSGMDLLNPWRGDRQPLLNHIAYSQFQIREIKKGRAFEVLNEQCD